MLSFLLLLAVVIGSILAFRWRGQTRSRLAALELRLAQIEAAVARGQDATGTAAAAPKADVPPEPEVPEAAAPNVPELPSSAEAGAGAPVEPGEPAVRPAEPPAEEPVPPPPQPPPATPPETAPSPRPGGALGLEELLGTRWVVWIGGLALALGGIFLVQYSIEQGLIGPAARIALGALLAAALIAAGEWLRRREAPDAAARLPIAHIPSILTAAGTVVAYATAYAAYALYGFIDGGVAFILLGAIALATLVAALLHGPALAAMGVVGAFVAPVLVSSQSPNYWALVLYLTVVTAAALALARARLWRWLAVTAVILSALWILAGLDDASPGTLLPFATYALAGFALAGVFMVSGFLLGPDPEAGRVEFVSSGALAAYLLAAALLVVTDSHAGYALAIFAAATAATVWIAGRTDAAAAAVPAAAVLASLVILDWALEGPRPSGIVRGGPGAASLIPDMLADNGVHLAVGAAFAALFGLFGFHRQGRSVRPVAPVLWATSAVFAPVAILVALYYRLAGFERSIPFALAALVLCLLFALATDLLSRRAPAPGLATAAAIFAIGSVAGLVLTLTFALEKGWLSVGFALMAPGVAWIANRRNLPMLRWLVLALVILVVGRIAYEQQLVGSDLGATPIFNWLLYSYGGPAASFWVAGWLLRRHADDLPTRSTESAAILFTVLLFFFEVRHWMRHGDVYAVDTGLAEAALQVAIGLALTIGLERVRRVTRSIVHDIGAQAIAVLTAIGIVFWLLIGENPWLTHGDVGGPLVNLVLLGYLVPALLLVVLVRVTRLTRPPVYRWTAEVAALVMMLAYLTLEVRRLYHGPDMGLATAVGDAEQYTYSAVWLAYGVVLLLGGIVLRSQSVRLASAAVIAITVAKVFLVDLSGLTGIYRALSFIVLGLVLVGIGLMYQRLLFPARGTARAEDGS